MKFPPHIKQCLTRACAAVYQPATSSDKRAWRARIKPWGSCISSCGKSVFKFLCVTLVVISVILAVVLFIAILWRGFDWRGADWIDYWLGTSHLAAEAKWETIKTLGQGLLGLGLIVGIYVAYIKRRWILSILPDKMWEFASNLASLVFSFGAILFTPLTVILLISLIWRIFAGEGPMPIDNLLGTSGLKEEEAETTVKRETVKTLAQALFGLALIAGIYIAYMRARASDNANEQQMFNDATAKLSDESASVRLGGIYALDRLARSKEAYLVRIVKILCTHLRETAQQDRDEEKDKKKDGEEGKKENEKRDKEKYAEKYKDKPSNEIQSLLEVLSELNRFSEEKQGDGQSKPVRLNLSGAYLVGAHLEDACLNRADLSRTNMQNAHLSRAQLQKANLENAKMQGAVLKKARMQKAVLKKAQMQEVDLEWAHMQMADLQAVRMQGAFLAMAHMQGVDLREARMQGALLAMAQLQGADLQLADMRGASVDRMQVQWAALYSADLCGAYCEMPYEAPPVTLERLIWNKQGEKADLDNVISSGGVELEYVQYIRKELTKCQKNGLMIEEEVKGIIAILEEHQRKPIITNLPKDLRQVGIDSYGPRAAKGIIKEYDNAMAGLTKNYSSLYLSNTTRLAADYASLYYEGLIIPEIIEAMKAT